MHPKLTVNGLHGVFRGYDGRRWRVMRRQDILDGKHRVCWIGGEPVEKQYLPAIARPKSNYVIRIPRVFRMVTDARVAGPTSFLPAQATDVKVAGSLYLRIAAVYKFEGFNDWAMVHASGDPGGYVTFSRVLQDDGTQPIITDEDWHGGDGGGPPWAKVMIMEFNGNVTDGREAAVQKVMNMTHIGALPVDFWSGPFIYDPKYTVKFRYKLPHGGEVETPEVELSELTANPANSNTLPTSVQMIEDAINRAMNKPTGDPNQTVDNTMEWEGLFYAVKEQLAPHDFLCVYKNFPPGQVEAASYSKTGAPNGDGIWLFRETVPGAQEGNPGGGENANAMMKQYCSILVSFNVQGLCDDTNNYYMDDMAQGLEEWIDDIHHLLLREGGAKYKLYIYVDKGFAHDWDLVEQDIRHKVHELRLVGEQAPSIWGFTGLHSLQMFSNPETLVDYKRLLADSVHKHIATFAKGFYGIEE